MSYLYFFTSSHKGNEDWKKRKTDKKTNKQKNLYALGTIGKQFGEFVESVQEKKRKATTGRICRKGSF